MAHPARLDFRKTLAQRSAQAERRLAELARSALDAPTEILRHQLHAVADTEHWHAELVDPRIDLRARCPRRPKPARRRGSAQRGSSRAARPPSERWPTSSEYTRASRTRRAISCEYWPPRSTTSTGPSSGTGRDSGAGNGSTSAPIVGRLLRDRHVVRVALLEAGRGDPDEPGLAPSSPRWSPRRSSPSTGAGRRRAGRCTACTGPLYGHAALDPLGDELVDVLDVALEVAVLRERAGLHRAERAHAAVLLVTARPGRGSRRRAPRRCPRAPSRA